MSRVRAGVPDPTPPSSGGSVADSHAPGGARPSSERRCSDRLMVGGKALPCILDAGHDGSHCAAVTWEA